MGLGPRRDAHGVPLARLDQPLDAFQVISFRYELKMILGLLKHSEATWCLGMKAVRGHLLHFVALLPSFCCRILFSIG